MTSFLSPGSSNKKNRQPNVNREILHMSHPCLFLPQSPLLRILHKMTLLHSIFRTSYIDYSHTYLQSHKHTIYTHRKLLLFEKSCTWCKLLQVSYCNAPYSLQSGGEHLTPECPRLSHYSWTKHSHGFANLLTCFCFLTMPLNAPLDFCVIS